jgi:hypothetical protein
MDIQDENIKMKGELTITVIDEFGNIKDKRHVPNLVVTAGKGFVASRMVGTSSAVMSHMAVGTNNTAPAAGDTALGTEVGRTTLSGSTPSGSQVTYSATFAAGTGTGALTEAAILNAGTGGTMLCRTTFSVVNKGASDTVSISWTVSVA